MWTSNPGQVPNSPAFNDRDVSPLGPIAILSAPTFPSGLLACGFGSSSEVVTAVSGYSRFMAAHMVPTRSGHDVLAGMLSCLQQVGGIPRTAVWVGEASDRSALFPVRMRPTPSNESEH
jgi:hypothetical protein